ncbi:arylamine N-acetyltransferase [Streptosporangium sp. NPDC051022]|uniref:arylamine N-acetyltransferase family protein n=1 Tax=Streptosporangium sp. NPDC051022 TaxID=3155752 RepID=UPI0034400078
MDEYLQRIGASRPPRPDAESLRDLQLRHLLTVPFENLSIHLGEPIVLDEQALIDKIVGRRRGGFCYELNGAFAVLLRSLGYQVTLLAARVFADGSLGPPFDHMALRVDAPDPWLVDVGFGKFTHYPLRFDLRTEQSDPGGSFRLAETEEGDLDVLQDGVPQYRLERRPRALADYEATCWWQQTSPRSHFARSLVCSLLTEGGRVTLSDRLLVRTTGDERREHLLATDTEVLAAYRDHFGIELTRLPVAPARQEEASE